MIIREFRRERKASLHEGMESRQNVRTFPGLHYELPGHPGMAEERIFSGRGERP